MPEPSDKPINWKKDHGVRRARIKELKDLTEGGKFRLSEKDAGELKMLETAEAIQQGKNEQGRRNAKARKARSVERQAKLKDLDLKRSAGEMTPADEAVWKTVSEEEKAYQAALERSKARRKINQRAYNKRNPEKVREASRKYYSKVASDPVLLEKKNEKLREASHKPERVAKRKEKRKELKKDPAFHEKQMGTLRAWRAANPEWAKARSTLGNMERAMKTERFKTDSSYRSKVLAKLEATKKAITGFQAEAKKKGTLKTVETNRAKSGTLKKGAAAVGVQAALMGASYLAEKLFKSKGDASDDKKYLRDKKLWKKERRKTKEDE